MVYSNKMYFCVFSVYMYSRTAPSISDSFNLFHVIRFSISWIVCVQSLKLMHWVAQYIERSKFYFWSPYKYKILIVVQNIWLSFYLEIAVLKDKNTRKKSRVLNPGVLTTEQCRLSHNIRIELNIFMSVNDIKILEIVFSWTHVSMAHFMALKCLSINYTLLIQANSHIPCFRPPIYSF